MQRSARVWSIAIAALLAFAVLFLWSPGNPGSFSPGDHGFHALHHSHASAGTRSGPRGDRHLVCNADCNASGPDCCLMPQCLPETAIDPQNITVLAADDEAIAAAMRVLGRGPDVVLPPPRPLLV